MLKNILMHLIEFTTINTFQEHSVQLSVCEFLQQQEHKTSHMSQTTNLSPNEKRVRNGHLGAFGQNLRTCRGWTRADMLSWFIHPLPLPRNS